MRKTLLFALLISLNAPAAERTLNNGNLVLQDIPAIPVSMIDVSRGGVSVFYTPRANPKSGFKITNFVSSQLVNSPNRPLCEAHDHPQAPWTPIKP